MESQRIDEGRELGDAAGHRTARAAFVELPVRCEFRLLKGSDSGVVRYTASIGTTWGEPRGWALGGLGSTPAQAIRRLAEAIIAEAIEPPNAQTPILELTDPPGSPEDAPTP